MFVLEFKEKINITLKPNFMKALKITLIVAVLFASLTSCTKQDLNEDDVLTSPDTEQVYYTGGDGDN